MSPSHLVWLTVALLIGVGAALWSYARLPVRVPRPWRYVLGALRAAAVAALTFLLAEPLYTRLIQREAPPRLVLLADNSQSLFWGGSLTPTAYREGLQQLATQLKKAGFEVAVYGFDRSLKPADSLKGDGQASWLSQAIQEVLAQEENPTALLVVSDGQETGEKTAPVPVQVPIWTIAAGPVAPPQDAAIEEVLLPPWVSEGQPVQLEVRVRPSARPATLTLTWSSGREQVPLSPQQNKVAMRLPALPKGLHRLTFTLAASGDPNPYNNTREEALWVRPKRPLIYLWAGEITADVGFLRRVLERIGPVQLVAARKPTGYTQAPDSIAWKEPALHVLYNFPARAEDLPWARRIAQENLFFFVVAGATLEADSLFWPAAGWQKPGLLSAYPMPRGPVLYLRQEGLHPTAQPIDIGWGRPIAYRYFRGNRFVAGLLGEGWWALRTFPDLNRQWDSLVTELIGQGLAFQEARLTFFPERNRVLVGDIVRWQGWLPPGTTLRIAGQTLPLQALSEGLYEAFWQADSVGTFLYSLSQGEKTLFTGVLTVEAPSREFLRLGRDTLYLRYLAALTSGQAATWEELPTLPERLRAAFPAQRLVSSHREVIPFHEWSVWLVVLLSLFSLEWLLRRYVGLY